MLPFIRCMISLGSSSKLSALYTDHNKMNSSEQPYSSQPVFRAFFIYAVALGTLFPRLGDIQIAMGVGEALLGLSILGLPVGLQISLLVADKLLRHFTMGQVMVAGTALIGCAYVGASLSPSPLFFFISLFFGGLSIGAMEVAVNLEADRVEAVIGRRIMNRAHAFWSLGFFTTGLIGALIAQMGITPFWHFLLLAAATTLFCVHYFLRYQQAPERASDAEATSLFVRPTKAIMVLVLLTLSAMLVEGSAIDWSAIFTAANYTYGPILGLFAFGLVTDGKPVDRWIPWVAVASPVLCYLLEAGLKSSYGFSFGFALLPVNGLLTFLGLWLLTKKQ